MIRISLKKQGLIFALMAFMALLFLIGLSGQSTLTSQAAPLGASVACFPTAVFYQQRIGNSPLGDNLYGDHLVDFDGDGKTDVFTVDFEGKYKFSSGARDPWQVLRQDSYPIEALRFGDFDADGVTDLFKSTNGQWAYSSGGVADWQNLGQSDVGIDSLRFGQFDDDPRTDVFYRGANGDWLYSSGGTSVWTSTGQNSGFPIETFRFVDLNGNGKTDVFRIDSLGQFIVSYDARESWNDLFFVQDLTIEDVRFGYFDGVAGADVFMELSGGWYLSSGGATSLQFVADVLDDWDNIRPGDFDGDGRTDIFSNGLNSRFQVAFAPIYDFTFLMPTIQTQTGPLSCIASDGSNGEISSAPAISGDGNRITFNSAVDLLGEGDVLGFEVWMYEVSTDKMTRITTGAVGSSSLSRSPDITADGNMIVFDSNVDLLGQGAGSKTDIWLYDVPSGDLERITTEGTAGRESQKSDVDGIGRRIVFESDGDFLNQGISAGESELWMYDRLTQIYTRITVRSAPDRQSFGPHISQDGQKVVFSSDSDFLNEGLPFQQYEIWLYDVVTGELTRLTDSGPNRQSWYPRIDGNGRQVVFSSDGDFNNEGLVEDQNEIWHLDLVSGALTRVTNGAPDRDSDFPDISADGTTIVFRGDADLLGQGLSRFHEEVWRYDIGSGSISRLTYYNDFNYLEVPFVTIDGRTVVFATDADYSGHGPGNVSKSLWSLEVTLEPGGGFNNYLPFVFK